MATIIDQVLIQISAQYGQLSRQLNQVVSQAQQAGQQASGAFSLAFGAGLAAAGFSLRQAAERFNEAEVQARLFQFTLERFGLSGEEAAKRFDPLIQRFGLLEDELQGASSQLIRSGANLEQIQALFIAAASSATLAKQDTSAAINAIATAVVTGRSELLETYGIVANLGPVYQAYAKSIGKTVDELTQQEKVQAGINAILQETKLEIEAVDKIQDPFTRAVQEQRKAWDDLVKSIGQQVLPLYTRTTQLVTQVLQSLNNLDPAVKQQIVTYAAWAGGIGAVIAGGIALNALIGTLGRSLLALAANPLTLTIAAITSIAVAFVKFGGPADETRQRLELIAQAFLGTGKIIIGFAQGAVGAITSLIDIINEALNDVAAFGRAIGFALGGDFAAAADELAKINLGDFSKALEDNKKQFEAAWASIKQGGGILADTFEGKVQPATKQTIADVEELITSLTKLGTASQKQNSSLGFNPEEFLKKQQQAGKGAQALAGDLDKLIATAQRLDSALTAALNSGDPKNILRARDAVEAFTKQGELQARVMAAVQAAAKGQGREISTLGIQLDTLADLYDANQITAEQYKTSLEGLLKTLQNNLASLNRNSEAYGETRRAVQDLASIIDELAGKIAATRVEQITGGLLEIANTARTAKAAYDSGKESIRSYEVALKAQHDAQYTALLSLQALLRKADPTSREFQILNEAFQNLRQSVIATRNALGDIRAEKAANAASTLETEFLSGRISLEKYAEAIGGQVIAQEKLVASLVKGTPEWIKQQRALLELYETQEQLRDQLNAIRGTRLEDSIAKWGQAYAKGEITAEQYRGSMQALIKALEGEAAQYAEGSPQREKFRKEIDGIKAQINELNASLVEFKIKNAEAFRDFYLSKSDAGESFAAGIERQLEDALKNVDKIDPAKLLDLRENAQIAISISTSEAQVRRLQGALAALDSAILSTLESQTRQAEVAYRAGERSGEWAVNAKDLNFALSLQGDIVEQELIPGTNAYIKALEDSIQKLSELGETGSQEYLDLLDKIKKAKAEQADYNRETERLTGGIGRVAESFSDYEKRLVQGGQLLEMTTEEIQDLITAYGGIPLAAGLVGKAIEELGRRLSLETGIQQAIQYGQSLRGLERDSTPVAQDLAELTKQVEEFAAVVAEDGQGAVENLVLQLVALRDSGSLAGDELRRTELLIDSLAKRLLQFSNSQKAGKPLEEITDGARKAAAALPSLQTGIELVGDSFELLQGISSLSSDELSHLAQTYRNAAEALKRENPASALAGELSILADGFEKAAAKSKSLEILNRGLAELARLTKQAPKEGEALAAQLKEMAAELIATDGAVSPLAKRMLELAEALKVASKEAEDYKEEIAFLSGLLERFGSSLGREVSQGISALSKSIASFAAGDTVGGILGLIDAVLSFGTAAAEAQLKAQGLDVVFQEATESLQNAERAARDLAQAFGLDLVPQLKELKDELNRLQELESGPFGWLFNFEEQIRQLREDIKEAEELAQIGAKVVQGIPQAFADALKQAIETGDIESAKELLRERLRDAIINNIIQIAVEAALTTGILADKLQELVLAIQEAIRTGDWSGVEGLIDGILADAEAALEGFAPGLMGILGKYVKTPIEKMAEEIASSLKGSFSGSLSSALLDGLKSGDWAKAKAELENRLKETIVQVIIDNAVKAALATEYVSNLLANLSNLIAQAIATGDWSGVKDAIANTAAEIGGIFDQLGGVLGDALGGVLGGAGGSNAALQGGNIAALRQDGLLMPPDRAEAALRDGETFRNLQPTDLEVKDPTLDPLKRAAEGQLKAAEQQEATARALAQNLGDVNAGLARTTRDLSEITRKLSGLDPLMGVRG